MKGSRQKVVGLCVLFGGAISAAQAANITFLQLTADPNAGSINFAEVIYDPITGLTTGPGAVGNGTMTSPGMLGTITGGVPGLAGSPPGVGLGPPFTRASDLTLTLTGFAPSGSASVGASSISQPLGAGAFTVTYTGIGGPLVLLTGTADGATVTERDTGGNASVLSGNVVYTGGLLLPGISDAGLQAEGAFSLALTGLAGIYGTTTVGLDQHLNGFSADAVATFDAEPLSGGGPLFPEPTVGLVAGAGMLLGVIGRRRNR